MIVIVVLIAVIEVLLIGTVVVLLKRTKKSNKISFQETYDLTDLPIVTFYNSGKKLNFILDTGCNNSIINESELEYCTYTTCEDSIELIGIEGNKKHVNNIVSIALSKGKQNFLENFQVSDLSRALGFIKQNTGVHVHGLIGNPFFTKYKYIIDFDELVAYTH